MSENDLKEPLPEVIEDADSFEGNALKKARSAVNASVFVLVVMANISSYVNLNICMS